jgi:hypothetical protein
LAGSAPASAQPPWMKRALPLFRTLKPLSEDRQASSPLYSIRNLSSHINMITVCFLFAQRSNPCFHENVRRRVRSAGPVVRRFRGSPPQLRFAQRSIRKCDAPGSEGKFSSSQTLDNSRNVEGISFRSLVPRASAEPGGRSTPGARRSARTPFHRCATRVKNPSPLAGEGGAKGRMRRSRRQAPAPCDSQRGPPIMSAIDGLLVTSVTARPLIRRRRPSKTGVFRRPMSPPSPARGEGNSA